MKPIEFVMYNGAPSPNTPIYQIMEAMEKDVLIVSEDEEYEIVSYYMDGERMVLEIAQKDCDRTRGETNDL